MLATQAKTKNNTAKFAFMNKITKKKKTLIDICNTYILSSNDRVKKKTITRKCRKEVRFNKYSNFCSVEYFGKLYSLILYF